MQYIFSLSSLSSPEIGKFQDLGLKNKAHLFFSYGRLWWKGQACSKQMMENIYGTDCELHRKASEAFDRAPSESFTVKTK